MKVQRNSRLLLAIGLGLLLGFAACSLPPTSPPSSNTEPLPQQTSVESKPAQSNPSSEESELSSQTVPFSAKNSVEEKEGNKKAMIDAPGDSGENADEAAATPKGHARTVQEEVSHLEGKLDESLREFDGMLLERRLAIKNEQKERAEEDFDKAARLYGQSSVSGNGETEDLPPPLPPSLAGEQRRSTSGGGSMPNSPEERRGDYDHAAVRTSVPPDIPKGNEEDVVARQLREAATQETDPDLRRKLWNEYRRYKGLPVKNE